jgi:hypothetical protein
MFNGFRELSSDISHPMNTMVVILMKRKRAILQVLKILPVISQVNRKSIIQAKTRKGNPIRSEKSENR